MRRRDFIAGFLVASIAPASAQQSGRVYRLAVVHPSQPLSDLSETGSEPYRAFFERLRALGYVEGRNLAVARYSGEGRTEQFAELVGDVVRSHPDVIMVSTSRLTRDFKAATATIPVVAIGADPVALGIVPSLARPGGNITGSSVTAGVEIWGKRLELLRAIVPTASRVAYLASNRAWEGADVAALREAAQRFKIDLLGPPLNPPLQESEYRRVIDAMVRAGADGLVIGDQAENSTNAGIIVELAAKARLPAIYPNPIFAHRDGLIAYGVEYSEIFRHAAEQIDEILKGTKPGDIPFYQPTKFELVINLKTAQALGLAVPATLLAFADEVIE